MSIDKDLLDQLMEGRSPGDLFGKDGVLSELIKALAERALSTELDAHLTEWTCLGKVPGSSLLQAAFLSKATGLFPPRAECLRRGL